MKTRSLVASFSLAAMLASTPAFAETYVIDTDGAHASVNFRAIHLGYSYVVGRFNDFEGSFTYDEANPGASSVNVTIDAASLDSNHAERDKHLRSEDFFEVETYPEITFASTGFTEESDGSISITGDLSMHGTTQSVVLEGNHIGHGEDPWGGFRRGMEASTMIDAESFGFPGWVGDVEVEVIVEGIRQ